MVSPKCFRCGCEEKETISLVGSALGFFICARCVTEANEYLFVHKVNKQKQNREHIVLDAKTRSHLTAELVQKFGIVPLGFEPTTAALRVAGAGREIPPGLIDELCQLPGVKRVDYLAWPVPSAVHETARRYYAVEIARPIVERNPETCCSFCGTRNTETSILSEGSVTICEPCVELANIVVAGALSRRGSNPIEVPDQVKLQGVRLAYSHGSFVFVVASRGTSLDYAVEEMRGFVRNYSVGLLYDEN